MMQTYVYIVAASPEGKRDHSAANAERVRFSLETMVQPAFLATAKNSASHASALSEAQVLVICADAQSDLSQETVQQALQAFANKPDGRIYVYGKQRAVASKIEGAVFVREKTNGMDELLRQILQMEEDDLDEFELARKMQEQMQEESDEQSTGRFNNLGNILFICGFIAAACIIFRIVVRLIG